MQGDIGDVGSVAAAVDGIDTIFHTAALIELLGGRSVTEDYRPRSFAVNVGGTQNLVHAAQEADVKRFVYTSSNSVVMGGKAISGGDETLPYTHRVADLYTEAKVTAEKFVLSQNAVGGLLTCAIRPSGIWGCGDQTMFRKMFESVVAGHVKALVGSRHPRLDTTDTPVPALARELHEKYQTCRDPGAFDRLRKRFLSDFTILNPRASKLS
jgi:3beta-hydroxy-delta5-steroid dehydrogenase/steroid delta-isomerase